MIQNIAFVFFSVERPLPKSNTRVLSVDSYECQTEVHFYAFELKSSRVPIARPKLRSGGIFKNMYSRLKHDKLRQLVSCL